MLCFLLLNVLIASSLWREADADCSHTQPVASFNEMKDAIACANAGFTLEIIVSSAIDLSEAISIADIPNVTILGTTPNAGFHFFNNLQRQRLFMITNSTVLFQDLILEGDSVVGCLSIWFSRVKLRGVHLKSLPTVPVIGRNDGLGMFLSNSSVLVENSIVSGWTSAPYGSAFFLRAGATLTLQGTLVKDNTALLQGGGVYVSTGCTLIVGENCHFENNQAVVNGGAICVHSSRPGAFWIRDSVFLNNSAANGGGVSVEDLSGDDVSQLVYTMSNVTFANNFARTNGGGMRLLAAGLLSNVTCTGNAANKAGKN